VVVTPPPTVAPPAPTPPPPAPPKIEPPPDDASEPRPSRAMKRDPLLLEIAWEVCNQLGGIYTVLRSKVPAMVNHWGSRYCLVGPYNAGTAAVEFEETPPVGAVGQAVRTLQSWGINAKFGRWLVSGRPHVVLIDYLSVFPRLHEVKYRLFADHGIEISRDDELLNNVVAFGECCRMLLVALAEAEGARRPLIAHFHEWMAGAGIPMLRHEQWPGSIVFTTHATLLGRYLAMNHPVFYEHLGFMNPDREAAHFNVVAQHRIERAAAHGAHVFTTVSDVTAQECMQLLGRRPDVLLPNGLNIQRFSAMHEFQNLHREYKERIHEFTMGHFFPSYSFDLDNTLYFFTSGRYEYRNKGMDLTIEALARLNYRLKAAGSQVTVVTFIITRTATKSINVTALQSRAMLQEFRTAADQIKQELGEKLVHAVTAGSLPDLNSLVDDYWRLRLRRTMHAWRRGLPPLIVTHDLIDDATDPVLQQLRTCQLFNRQEDPVKVVYHPDFITASNPLWGMDYDQFVRGCHLGVFPSYYEPWGYTPLESIALGVPAVTSDLSGFGSYIVQLLPDHEEKGLYVLRRKGRDFNSAADELADRMFRYAQQSRRERIALRNMVESFSEHFDWHNLGRCYHEAHELALDRLG
jgi:glycogen(starch) synthase